MALLLPHDPAAARWGAAALVLSSTSDRQSILPGKRFAGVQSGFIAIAIAAIIRLTTQSTREPAFAAKAGAGDVLIFLETMPHCNQIPGWSLVVNLGSLS